MAKMDKTTKILIWATAMMIILISGGITAIVLNNRFHTERDNALAQQQAQQKKSEQEQKQRQATSNTFSRTFCVSSANTAYWDYVKLNAISTTTDSNGQPVYRALQTTWDTADKQKQEALNNCYQQYPTN
jgi:flagellar basal body-associated protein FliL